MTGQKPSGSADKTLLHPDPRDAALADLAAQLDQAEQESAALRRQIARQTRELAHLSRAVLDKDRAGQQSVSRKLLAGLHHVLHKLGR